MYKYNDFQTELKQESEILERRIQFYRDLESTLKDAHGADIDFCNTIINRLRDLAEQEQRMIDCTDGVFRGMLEYMKGRL